MPKKEAKKAVKAVAKVSAKAGTKAVKKIAEKSSVKEVQKKAAVSKMVAKAEKLVAAKPVEKTEKPALAKSVDSVKTTSSVAKPAPAAKKVRIPIPEGLTGEAAKLALKWRQLFEKSQEEEAQPYKMTGSYLAKSPIKHKILGWGYVLSSNNNRIEVLFQNGIKTLVTDYKE